MAALMRDPLSPVPIRVKLPLTFAFLCAVAFGLSGWVVNTAARNALEHQILLRLGEGTASTHRVVDGSLELLERRAEDFASDGHIRLELERLLAAGDSEAERPQKKAAQEELVRHLRANKLVLISELADAYLVAPDGRLVVRAASGSGARPAASIPRSFGYGPLTPPTPEYPYPTFVVSTPVMAIDGSARLGTLAIVVRADLWAAQVRRSLGPPNLDGLEIALSGPDGYRLPLAPEAAAGAGTDPDAGVAGRLVFSAPNPRTGWTVDLSIDRRVLTSPFSRLASTFLYAGLALVALTLLLTLPSWHFLLKPLQELENVAHKITAGDFSARVGYRSGDEVGHLAEVFNLMAAAIEERTAKLGEAAEDLRHREAEIRREHDRLGTVIHSLEDGLFILDREGRITLANEGASDILGVLATGLRDIPTELCPRRRGHRPHTCLECLADYRHVPHPCVVAVNGRTYDIRATSLLDPDGTETERIFVSRDVTERRLHASRQAHQERLSVLGEVAAVMAHEMNNPLAAISMFSQMLLEKLDASSPLRTHAEVVHRNTLSCKRTIRSLLDMATASSPELEEFDLRDMVDDVAELLRPIAEQGRTVLRVDTEARDGLVHASELQLRQALINLVMNAIQAVSREEERQITLSTLDRPREVVIRVHDTGPGIAPELRERIFESFFTTKPPGEGTGLGLPTARRTLEAHGGRLILRDDPGPGTTFEMVIPRRRGTGEIAIFTEVVEGEVA